MDIINFKIVTPERVVYEKTIHQVTLPTAAGEITVLPHHIPLVTVLKTGEMLIKDEDGERPIAVAGGFVEVKDGEHLVVMADNAERAEEIDVERAEKAKARAEEQMKASKAGDDIDFARLQAVIEREMNRIKVGKKYRNLPPAQLGK